MLLQLITMCSLRPVLETLSNCVLYRLWRHVTKHSIVVVLWSRVEVEAYLHLFLTTALDECGWSTSLSRCIPPEESLRCPFNKRLLGPKTSADTRRKEKYLIAFANRNTVSRFLVFSIVTTPTELSRLRIFIPTNKINVIMHVCKITTFI